MGLKSSTPNLYAFSGRLDACRVAEAVGHPVDQIAQLADVSVRALSVTPDLHSVQAVLRPMAQLATLMDETFSGASKRAWLQKPNPAFGSRAPSTALVDGEAEFVLLKGANALAGHPD